MLTINQLKELTTGQLAELLEGIQEVLANRDTSHPKLPVFADAEPGSGYEGDIYDADAELEIEESNLVGQN